MKATRNCSRRAATLSMSRPSASPTRRKFSDLTLAQRAGGASSRWRAVAAADDSSTHKAAAESRANRLRAIFISMDGGVLAGPGMDAPYFCSGLYSTSQAGKRGGGWQGGLRHPRFVVVNN